MVSDHAKSKIVKGFVSNLKFGRGSFLVKRLEMDAFLVQKFVRDFVSSLTNFESLCFIDKSFICLHALCRACECYICFGSISSQ